MRVESQFKVTLLGTGVPTPRLERFEYAAHAVIAGNEERRQIRQAPFAHS